MRTTLNTIYTMIGTNLNKITSDLGDINRQISSGQQMSKISDDPINMISALRYRTSVEELGQYSENINAGNTIINSSESAMSQMNDLIIRAKTLAIQAVDPALSQNEHTAIAEEISHILEQAVLLGNSSVNGKYIFGGHRTTGYTDEEPAPFVTDTGNGYWVNGSSMAPIGNSLNNTVPNVAPPLTDIANGDLLINGENIGAITLTPAAPVNGINMVGTEAIVSAINGTTTSYANVAVTADTADGIASSYKFDLNGTTINVNLTDGSAAAVVAADTIAAINLESANTGVTAIIGNGANGGPVNSIVFQNTTPGDNSTIEVSNFETVLYGGATLGFTDFSKKIITASMTTLYASGVANAETNDGIDSIFSFDLNNTAVNVKIPNNSTAAETADYTVKAINRMSDRTGVIAEVGDGANGGPLNAIIFKNAQTGDSSAINLDNFSSLQGDANPANLDLGSFPINQAADATHNTGELTLTSEEAFTITSPNHTDDTILDALGLGGGSVGGFIDDPNDGTLLFGYDLAGNDLLINGTALPDPVDDGLSSTYQVFSAAAKANAINSITSQTGVSAEVIPASMTATGAVSGGIEDTNLTGLVAGGIGAGNLEINGFIIPTTIAADGADPANGLNMGTATNARDVLNSEQPNTNVRASLTTLYTTNVAGTADNLDFVKSVISFDVNGQNVKVTIPDGATSAEGAALAVAEINALTNETGVTALVGDGTNGGALNSIVFKNSVAGDESAITVSNYTSVQGNATLGFGDFSQTADRTHNTGEISLASDTGITLRSVVVPINTLLAQIGLRAPQGETELTFESTPKYIDAGDLVINGVDIFSKATPIKGNDLDNTMVRTINEKTAQTGVVASRNENGELLLSVEDGRNLQIKTSVNGENITNLNGSNSEQVYFGSLKIVSDRAFNLETAAGPQPNQFEAGFASLGLSGGEATTGEAGDISGDGKIAISTIRTQEGSVRYAGDRENDLTIKIGRTNTMLVGENGQSGIVGSNIFTSLQSFENALRGTNFTSVTGVHKATDTAVTLNSRTTGLEPDSLLPDEDLFTASTFSVNVFDNSYHPPRQSQISIAVDPDNDTLNDVAQRINGIPHMTASWNSDGQLELESSEPGRYSFTLDPANNNFLEATGVSHYFLQEQAFEQAISNFDGVMSALSEQISDFGARANRITSQQQIYLELSITAQENLSEVQDTDIIQAIMDLKSKEVAYQAALSAASKTMQLSLVDYL